VILFVVIIACIFHIFLVTIEIGHTIVVTILHHIGKSVTSVRSIETIMLTPLVHRHTTILLGHLLHLLPILWMIFVVEILHPVTEHKEKTLI
jgi:hypothetical protein